MKLSFSTVDFEEQVWQAFAVSIGWTPQVMTTTESPNYLIDNPITFGDFIINKYGQPLYQDLANFNVAQVKEQTDAAIATATQTLVDAQSQAEEEAKTLITVTIE